MAAQTGPNVPAGAVQRNVGIYASSPGGGMLWGQHSNQRVMMARIGVTSAAGGETASFWVPNVDDNFGLYVEDPSDNPNGTVSTVLAAVTGVSTSFQTTDVGKLLLITSGGAPKGQANLITARSSTTAITLQERYSTAAGGQNYKLLSPIIQRSNGVAQTTNNDVATYAFTIGNSVLWLFYNQDGATQAALNLYTDMYEVSGLSFYDVGKESFV